MAFRTFIFSILLTLSIFVFCQNPEIDHLKTDYQTTPLGFDNPIPEFSWILKSSERGFIQSAYEISVGDDFQNPDAGNCGQSGKISGNQTFGIRYAGKPLESFTHYFWKVRVWNQNGDVSEWSQPSWFETSMMKPSDWKAQWISDQRPLPEKDEDFYKETPNQLLRKEIVLKKKSNQPGYTLPDWVIPLPI